MNNEESNKLTVKLNNKDITIDVIDIVTNPKIENREYMVYTIDGLDKDEIFASILNESETSYSLDTIENEEELNFINTYIRDVINTVNEIDDDDDNSTDSNI